MFTSHARAALLSCVVLALPAIASAQTVGQVLDINDLTTGAVEVTDDQIAALTPDRANEDEPVRLSVTPRERGGAVKLEELANPKSKFYQDRGTFSVEGPRKRIIESAARGVGIRGGFAFEAERINKILMAPKYRNALAAHYPFSKLLLQSGYIVPPVITKVSNVRELPNQNFLSLTVGSYEITREPRLTTLKPTWMDYLLLPVRGVKPPQDIKLEGSGENSLWNTTVKNSWADGVQEARSTFVTALATLNRDYNGMVLYHQLAKQGAVSIPTVDVSRINWRVTPDGKRAYEGEVQIEITVGPKFRARRK